MQRRPWLSSIPVIVRGLVCCFTFGKEEAPAPNLSGIHPEVFRLVTGWLSDTVQPVVREISRDAIAQNHNQFDFDAVKRSPGWTESPGFGESDSVDSSCCGRQETNSCWSTRRTPGAR